MLAAKDFGLDLRKCVSPPNHIFVGSGYSTCSTVPGTVTGVRECYSPPLAAPDTVLSFSFRVGERTVEDSGSLGKDDCGLLPSSARWLPDRIIRRGTYHYGVGENLISFSAESELIPLTGISGFLIKITLTNRLNRDFTVSFLPDLNAGHPVFRSLGDWDFGKPKPSPDPAVPCGDCVWSNREAAVRLFGGREIRAVMPAGGNVSACFAVVLTAAGTSLSEPFDPEAWEQKTVGAWQDRLDTASRNLPELRSDIPGLENYYRRSVLSGLVCLWDNDAFAMRPFPATCGIDGGSICCYPWDDAGYSAEFLTMLLGNEIFVLIRLMLRSGIDRHICMAVNGQGSGKFSYSYSLWSIVNCYRTAVFQTGKGKELFDEIAGLLMSEDAKLPEKDYLKDYGVQHNLLEMRTRGYEHFVPSPNAERAWCYRALGELAERFGRTETASDFLQKAERIQKAIMEQLWDPHLGWFRCLFPDGSNETVYSIQIFDAVRLLPCDGEILKAVFRHLKDGAFLGKYGVSSVSAEDSLHYELNDPDWSGGGCFSGDACMLARMLWEKEEPALAWDVLKRLFWMGEMLPYSPQEHYCDSPAVPAHKRANDIAGTAGMEAILYGMAGIAFLPGGAIRFRPHPVPEGKIEISNIRHGGKIYSLLMEPGRAVIRGADGFRYDGAPQELILR